MTFFSRVVNAAGYLWAAPNSLLGLAGALAAVVSGGCCRWREGVLEVEGGLTARALARLPLLPSGAAAVTLGHVVLAQSGMFSPMLRTHERVHVAQYALWGPFFLPAYCASSLWAWASGGDPYRDNVFEREAFACSDACEPPDSLMGPPTHLNVS